MFKFLEEKRGQGATALVLSSSCTLIPFSLRKNSAPLPSQGKVFFNRVEIATDGFDERWNRTY